MQQVLTTLIRMRLIVKHHGPIILKIRVKFRLALKGFLPDKFLHSFVTLVKIQKLRSGPPSLRCMPDHVYIYTAHLVLACLL